MKNPNPANPYSVFLTLKLQINMSWEQPQKIHMPAFTEVSITEPF